MTETIAQTDDDLDTLYSSALNDIDDLIRAGESGVDEMRALLIKVRDIAQKAVSA